MLFCAFTITHTTSHVHYSLLSIIIMVRQFNFHLHDSRYAYFLHTLSFEANKKHRKKPLNWFRRIPHHLSHGLVVFFMKLVTVVPLSFYLLILYRYYTVWCDFRHSTKVQYMLIPRLHISSERLLSLFFCIVLLSLFFSSVSCLLSASILYVFFSLL